MRAAGRWAAWALLYLLGAVAFTWPMPQHLADAVWGDRFDTWTTLWLIDHLHGRLMSGDWSETSQAILYPLGYNLWSFGHVGVQLVGVALMALGLPVVAAYNVLNLLAFTTTGLGAHALGRRLSGGDAGGLLAGATFTFNPYTYGEMAAGCVELVAAGLLPLYALSLVRLSDAPSPRRAVVAGLTLAVIGPFNWYYTAFAGMFTGVFWLWRLITPSATRAKTLTLLPLAVLGAALTNAPLIPKVRQETPSRVEISAESFSEARWRDAMTLTDGSVPLQALTEERMESADTMQVVINSTSLQNLARGGFPTNPLESTPGRLAWIVGLVGLAASGRRGLPWAVFTLGFTTLTLGPFVQLDATPPLPEWSSHTPLPYYALYNELPFFAKAYRPYRIGVLSLMCLSALGAVGLAALSDRARWALAGPLALAMMSQPLWTGAADRALADARHPEAYAKLNDAPPGAVIELPLLYQPATPANARFQYNQLAHRRPMLNCNQLIRRTDLARFRDYVSQNTLLTFALDLGRAQPPYGFTWADVRALKDQGFGLILTHTALPEELAQLAGDQEHADRLRQPAWDMLDAAFGPPVLDAEGLRAYALPEDAPAEGEVTSAGHAWVDLDLKWDSVTLHLTLLPNEEGLALPLGEGATRLSMWALRPEAAPGEGSLTLVVGDARLPLPTTPGAWTRLERAIPAGVTSARLIAEGGPARLRLSAVQVERAGVSP
ncbi:MAG: hypothetical protein IPN01_01265 [Deltaproteobacteria bacterium]|nr:hypothetical protein [Deltaproteobacteria bacterium]